MVYGPGASAKLWRQFFPEAEIWFGEYDKECVTKHLEKTRADNISVVTGDQANFEDLNRWVSETGGGFDVIVDDGGHSNAQQYNSFITLFEQALRPGGIYVIEDLETTLTPPVPVPHMVTALLEWIENLITFPFQYERRHKHPMPLHIRAIQCASQACVITKCYTDDKRCKYNGLDNPDQVNPNATRNGGYM